MTWFDGGLIISKHSRVPHHQPLGILHLRLSGVLDVDDDLSRDQSSPGYVGFGDSRTSDNGRFFTVNTRSPSSSLPSPSAVRHCLDSASSTGYRPIPEAVVAALSVAQEHPVPPFLDNPISGL